MNIMKSILKAVFTDSKGQALIAALVLLVVGALTITPMLYLASSVNIGARANAKYLYGFYAADAGLQRGLWKLRETDNLPYNGILPETINGMTVSVTTTNQTPASSGFEHYYRIVAQAMKGTDVVTTIAANVTQTRVAAPVYYPISFAIAK